MKEFHITTLFIINLLSCCLQPQAWTAEDIELPQGEELRQEMLRLMESGALDDALRLAQKLYDGDSKNSGVAMGLAHIYALRNNYMQSARYFEDGLQRRQAEKIILSSEAKAFPHLELAMVYDDLGRQKYFSAELCLRILYHANQAWPCVVEATCLGSERSQTLVEVAQRVSQYYALAKVSKEVMEKHGESPEELARAFRERPPELTLPPDSVDEATKLEAKDSLIARRRAYDQRRH